MSMHMGIKKRFFNMLPLFVLLLAAPAVAAPALENGAPPVNFKGLYRFGFSGIEFGKLGMEVRQGPGGYAITSDIMTTGLVRVFVKHSSHTTVSKTGPDLVYEASYKTKNKPKYVKMTKKGDNFTEVIATPPDSSGEREPVSAEQREGAYDPLSFVLAMRKELHTIQRDGRKTYSLLYYDGRRVTKGTFRLLGKETIMLNKTEYKVIKVAARRELIAGFTPKERRNYNEKEPDVLIYYSDDEKLLPIHLEAKMTFGTISATLEKQCQEGESCLLGNKD